MNQVATKSRTPKRPRRAKPRRSAATKAKGKRQAPRPGRENGAEQPIGKGGRRLADAFDVVSSMPVLAESRRRLLVASEDGAQSAGELADAVMPFQRRLLQRHRSVPLQRCPDAAR